MYTQAPPSEHSLVRKIVAEGTMEGFGKWSLDEDGLLTIDREGDMPE